MILDSGKSEGNVLEEFDLEGVPAQVVMVQPEDLNPEILRMLVENLTDANFKLLDVPHAQARMKIRELILSIRGRVTGQNSEERELALSDLKWRLENSEFDHLEGMNQIRTNIDKLRILTAGALGAVRDDFVDGELTKMGDIIYPDYARSEHVDGNKRRYELLIKDMQLLGVKVDGKLVAVQGFSKVADTQSGREVYEFTKASTLDYPEYRKKGFNSRMKKMIFDKIQSEHPEAIWVGASASPEQIKRFQRRGWHVVEVDDNHEAIVAMNVRHPGYAQTMKEQKYKAFYFDPKVDVVKWD